MLSLLNPLFPVLDKSKSDNRISPRTYVDRLFEDSFNTMVRDLFAWSPISNLDYQKNEDGTLSVSIDVPGIRQEDLTIEIKDNTVNVKGETKTERSCRKVSQAFTIPEGYNTDEIKAELDSGILTLTLPTKHLPQPEVKKIAVTSKK
jgi:HSP20 family protein